LEDVLVKNGFFEWGEIRMAIYFFAVCDENGMMIYTKDL
jgi:hypothetical protein